MNLDYGCLEVVVKRRNNPMLKVLNVLLIALAVALIVIGLAPGMWVLLIAGIACGVGAFFVQRDIDVEYEYSYVEKELRVAKIMKKSARKDLGKYDLNKLEIGAPINSYRLDNARHKTVKTLDYSSREEKKPDPRYELYLSEEKLIIEPNEDLKKVLRQAFPHKFYTD